jgi:hypothetical protein
MYELFIEGQKADINDQISVQLTFAIDDVANFASRETTFSKQIVLPGTAANHSIFGHVYEMGSNNPFSPGQPNIGAAFNVAQTSRAELRLNGLLVLRGIFRLTGIIKDGNFVEYEGALFGELSGLMSEISNKKLEDLDFSEYNHTWDHTTVSASWDNTPGSGYFYPLIDYGLYRETAIVSGLDKDYELDTFRPALYVKQYIDKMFAAAGYTYSSTFLNTDYFKSLIIPQNKKQLTNSNPVALDRQADDAFNVTVRNRNAKFPIGSIGLFSANFDSDAFTLGGSIAINAKISTTISINSYNGFGTPIRIQIRKGSTVLNQITVSDVGEHSLYIENVFISVGDVISVRFLDLTFGSDMEYTGHFNVYTTTATEAFATSGAQLYINDSIPKGIFQKDFLASIVKMFNLYIWEDKENEKRLYIEPYINYLTANDIDWTYKVARDKSWQISPMGNLNGRIFEYKYKDDNDFYNESYRKKFNQNYADRQFDTGFQFSADRVSTEIIFASSPLIQYPGTDKYLVPIYKKSNELSAEDRMDSNIRILFSKKKSCDTWNIRLGINSYPKTSYGYAGHLDDPITPTQDLNFGAPGEVYFSGGNYPSTNLFNSFWSGYIAQIADKDSKILRCYVYLKPVDIAQLDFANPIFIDGVRFRLNKITDYDYTNNDLVQVELLKIIENG